MSQSKLQPVTKSNFVFQPSEDVYKMTSKPRGPCLIIDNMYFKYLPIHRRSKLDAIRLEHAFLDLEFTVKSCSNLTKQEMKKALIELAEDDATNAICDALVVIILTHGYKEFIFGFDFGPEDTNKNNILTCEEIVEFFSNTKCPLLRNKPKLFFFQTCYDEKHSFGWESSISSSYRQTVERIPDVSDVLLSFAAQKVEEFRTIGSKDEGSIYAAYLYDVLTKMAHERDLQDILAVLERRFRDTVDSAYRRKPDEPWVVIRTDQLVSTSVKLLGWTKKLFFNPATKDAVEISFPSPREIFSKMGYKPPTITRLEEEEEEPMEDKLSLEPALHIPVQPSPVVPAVIEGRQPSLWVLGGSQEPEMLFPGGFQWITRTDTNLDRDHKAIAFSQDPVLVFNQYGICTWNHCTNTVTEVTRVDPPRNIFAHVFYDGRIYLIGGEVDGMANRYCRIYDISINEWSADLYGMTWFTSGRSAVVLRGKIFLTPGRKDQVLNKLDMLDPETGHWTQMAGHMKVERYGHALAACDKYIWVVGGHDGKRCIPDVERYCPGTSAWEQMKPMNYARANLSVTFFNGKMYAIGGETLLPERRLLDVVEIYDPVTDEWETGPTLQSARAEHTSVVLR